MVPAMLTHNVISARALNVKVKNSTKRGKRRSNYDSLKVAKCLVIYLLTRMNGLTRFPLSCLLSTKPQPRNGLGRISGERRPCCLTLVRLCEMT
ncbi:uncharacterized protein M6B38_407015 [Iris pallida]|uniref:Uncharacterized protein n=1 Tax=Iris pallida TaxID=29817 RepID=A0AAX6FPR7_IRIPA|nr:uncharacterized protein M6B38_407015 [Iris pallida]